MKLNLMSPQDLYEPRGGGALREVAQLLVGGLPPFRPGALRGRDRGRGQPRRGGPREAQAQGGEHHQVSNVSFDSECINY